MDHSLQKALRLIAPLGPWLIFALGLALSWSAAELARRSALDHLRDDFGLLAREQGLRVQAGLDRAMAAAEALAGFVAADQWLRRAEFETFVGALLDHHPFLHQFAWVERVPGERRASYEAEALADEPGFRIRDRGIDGALVPARARSLYYPVRFCLRQGAEPGPIGYDIGAESIRRGALERAENGGSPVVSGRLQLKFDPQRPHAVMLIVPVNEVGGDGLRGFAVGVLRPGLLVHDALRGMASPWSTLHLVDQSALGDDRHLTPPHLAPAVVRSLAPVDLPIRVPGRDWRIELRPTPAFLGRYEDAPAWGLLLAGAVISGLVGLYLRHRRRAFLALAAQAAELGQTQARLDAVVDTLPYGILENDPEGLVTYGNPALHRILGMAPGSLTGRRIWDFAVTIEEAAGVRAYLERIRAQLPDPTPFFSRHRRADGRVVDLRADWTCLRDSEGRVTGFVSILSDVTEALQTRDALARERDLVRGLVEVSDAILVQTDRLGGLRAINPAGCALLGYGEDELLGRNWVETCVPEPARTEAARVFTGLLHGEGAAAGPMPVAPRRGREIQVQWRHGVIRDAEGQVTLILSAGRPVE